MLLLDPISLNLHPSLLWVVLWHTAVHRVWKGYGLRNVTHLLLKNLASWLQSRKVTVLDTKWIFMRAGSRFYVINAGIKLRRIWQNHSQNSEGYEYLWNTNFILMPLLLFIYWVLCHLITVFKFVGYMALNGMMIMHDELERMWNKANMAFVIYIHISFLYSKVNVFLDYINLHYDILE